MEFDILRKVLIKNKCETDPGYGCDPEKREILEYISKGVVNIDKPSGPSSHQVASWVKEILNVEKVGHSGTLDPDVTGVLTCTLQNGVKISKYLLTAGKEYVCVMNLHERADENQIKKVFEYFTGEIYQKPPLQSAVKREIRKRKVYYINFLEMDGRDVLFNVGCEAGVYIRKLCVDIGFILGMGAHMVELRRTKSGAFDESFCVTLHDLKDAYEFWKENGNETFLRKTVLPMEKAVEQLKKIWIKDSAVDAVCYGANLNIPGVCMIEEGIKVNDIVAIFSLKNELVAIGRSLRTSEEIMDLNEGEVVDLERVIMERDIYPKKWCVGSKEV